MHASSGNAETELETQRCTTHVRQLIREHMAETHTEERIEAMKGLRMDEILHEDNIDLAISAVKKDTVPGADGFSTNFYAKTRIRSAAVLRELFRHLVDSEDMTEAMKTAVISILYKGKEKDKEAAKSYRPISITPAEYRILTRAIQQKLEPAVRTVIGKTQVGYLSDGRRARDNTVLLGETARALDTRARVREESRCRWITQPHLIESNGNSCTQC